jgi:hypothetical protein
MSKLVFRASYISDGESESVTNVYNTKRNAINNCPSFYGRGVTEIVEYELIPTGRKYDMKGVLIE